MASSMDELKLIHQKYEREIQGGEDGLDTIFQYLEMAVYIYMKQNEDDGEEEEEGAIFVEQMTLTGEGKKQEKKEKRSLRSVKTAQKEKNKVKRGHCVGKQQKGGKQNKREMERQGVREDKEKKKQERREGMRSPKGGEQDVKKQKFFRDNG